MTNTLYYGDNLEVLREHIADASVDLIYLDPPFNSNASYNVLFRAPSGGGTDASIEAFDDTWQWGPSAEDALADIRSSGNHKLHTLMAAIRTALGDNALMAYLAMMAVRLQELHRVLKDTGSLYLHCDPTASHYLKLVLDAVFGAENFRNEITWKRTSSHNDASQGLSRFGRTHDVILFYSKAKGATWHLQFGDYSEAYTKQHYSNVMPDGRRYKDAAEKLGRRWIGIDVTHLAIGLIEKRMHEGYDTVEGPLQFEVIGVPKDKDSALRLAAEKPHDFQNWFCLKVGGYPLDGGRKGADRGVDGHFYPYENSRDTSTGVISVKAGHIIGVAMIRDLRGVMESEGFPFGLFLSAYEPTGPMKAEAAAAGVHENDFGRFPRLQILTPADLFHGAPAKLPPLAPINRRHARVETRQSHKSGGQGSLL